MGPQVPNITALSGSPAFAELNPCLLDGLLGYLGSMWGNEWLLYRYEVSDWNSDWMYF